jgi:DNA-binding NtrC family response regulator
VVLVVEDEPIIRMELVDSLVDFGFQVKEAGSLGEARQILQHGGVAALITDVALPDGRGDELALQARKSHAELPVIMTTGYGDEVLKGEFAGQGYTAFLTKPYRAEQIADLLRNMGI